MRIVPLFIMLLLTQLLLGQSGGSATYQFLNLPFSGRAAALGGKVVASDNPDISLILQNPALIDSSLNQAANLYFTRYYAGVNYASLAYVIKLFKRSTIGLGLQGVNYGSFVEANESGVITGTFTGADMAFSVSYCYYLDSNFRVGTSIRPVYSHLERYSSFGLIADIGGAYQSSNLLFSAGFTLKNIGFVIKPYSPGIHEGIPFEIVAGASKKLAHAPFRFIVTLHQLQNMNLYYSSSIKNVSLSDGTEKSQANMVDRVGRELISHVIAGIEFIPLKSFSIQLGYNYQRRKELKVEERLAMVGFSWGIGLHLKKYDISFSRATYHITGSTNHFAITTNLRYWR